MLLHTLLLTACLPIPQELGRAELRAVIAPLLEATGTPGTVVSILNREQPILVEAFGLADVEGNIPMTRETRFQVGSVTKPLTATLLGLLHEEHALELDQPIAKYLPAEHKFSAKLKEVRVCDLMSHSAGLPREPINRRNRPNSARAGLTPI